MSGTAVTLGRTVKLSTNLLAVVAALVLIAYASPAVATGKQPRVTNGIERFSVDPSGKFPYFSCPPPTRERASCQSILIPTSAKPGVRESRRELGLVGKGVSPALEGGGVEGGFSPTDLRSAYNVAESGGKGATIAIVDAYGYARAESDLATYRSHYGLPECTTANGCFRKLNQKGEEGNYPAPPEIFERGWLLESALDLDMASAICPECKLVLVQANDALLANLGAAENTAAGIKPTVISNSWGANERPEDVEEDALYYNHPGIPMFFSSGDNGYFGSLSSIDDHAPHVMHPASSPAVVAVGGTSLVKSKDKRSWHESAWAGAGSGCSRYEKKPVWQTDKGCVNRTVADVSAVSDPRTPVSVYASEFFQEGSKSPGWLLIGGTSAAAPMLAGVEARASEAERAKGAQLFWEQGAEGKLFDVVEGYNGPCYPQPAYLCSGKGDYDGPTGWGTPGATRPGPPVAGTGEATQVTPVKATLTGIVNPNRSDGKSASYHWEVGTTTAYLLEEALGSKSLPSGTVPVEVSTPLTGLNPETTYHYRLVASSPSGTTYGADHTFTTSRWSTQEEPGTIFDSITQVSCGNSNDCMGVGQRLVIFKKEGGGLDSHPAAYAIHWDGSKWADASAIVPHEIAYGVESEFSDVSCTSASFCMTVGLDMNAGKKLSEGGTGTLPLTEMWNGSKWSLTAAAIPAEAYFLPEYGYTVNLRHIDCLSSTSCLATGNYWVLKEGKKFTEPLTEGWDGSKWVVKYAGGINSSGPLTCASASWCMSINNWEKSEYVNVWNGSKWTVQSESVSLFNTTDVSCTSTTSCVATSYVPGHWNGEAGGTGGFENEDAGRIRTWNGTKWSEQSVKGHVASVSCLSASWCVAVGFTGGYYEHDFGTNTFTWIPQVSSAYRWNGSSWTAETPTTPVQARPSRDSELFGVDCSGNGCTAVGGYVTSTSYGFYPVADRLDLTPVNLTPPTVSPNPPWEGLSVSATTGTWQELISSYTYQWQRCESGGTGCVNISGATSSTYTTTAADAGHTLVVRVKAYREGVSTPGEAASSPTAKVVAAGAITGSYSLPAGSSPKGITAGPDGKLWFTDEGSDKIGKITTTGTVTEYALPASSDPTGIAKGPDGNLWYTDFNTSKIGKITTGGTKTEYTVGGVAAVASGIVAGPDGNIWVTDPNESKIRKVTTAGAVTTYSLPAESEPTDIAVGSDGKLWFTEYAKSKIAKITTGGTITEYAIGLGAEYIAPGPDGNLWFTTAFGKYGKITTSGVTTTFTLPESAGEAIVAGPDNRMWFPLGSANKIDAVVP
jgi:streptogramin lyase